MFSDLSFDMSHVSPLSLNDIDLKVYNQFQRLKVNIENQENERKAIYFKMRKRKKAVQSLQTSLDIYLITAKGCLSEDKIMDTKAKYQNEMDELWLEIKELKKQLKKMDSILRPAWFCKDGEGFFSNQQNRYMVVDENRIYYFTNKFISFRNYRGYIDLRKIYTIFRNNHLLQLYEEYGGRVWTLRSDDKNVLLQWYNHCLRKIRKLRPTDEENSEIHLSAKPINNNQVIVPMSAFNSEFGDNNEIQMSSFEEYNFEEAEDDDKLEEEASVIIQR